MEQLRQKRAGRNLPGSEQTGSQFLTGESLARPKMHKLDKKDGNKHGADGGEHKKHPGIKSTTAQLVIIRACLDNCGVSFSIIYKQFILSNSILY